jgi:predicted peroxiredoxin
VVHDQHPERRLVGAGEAVRRPLDLLARHVAEIQRDPARAAHADQVGAADRDRPIELLMHVPAVGAERAGEAAEHIHPLDVVIAGHGEDRRAEARQKGGDAAPGGRLLGPLDQVSGCDDRVRRDALGGLVHDIRHLLDPAGAEVEVGNVKQSTTVPHPLMVALVGTARERRPRERRFAAGSPAPGRRAGLHCARFTRRRDMANYLLIESRDPWDSADTATWQQMAIGLAAAGNTVTCFLVQNGVLPARRSGRSAGLTALARAGVEVLADEFSLRERGIAHDRLAAGVKPAPIDVVIDHMCEGRKVLWH